MRPADLAAEPTLAIEEVLDVGLFNQEAAAERSDAAKVVAVQERCDVFFKSLKVERGD
jgi:hypothetical protein